MKLPFSISELAKIGGVTVKTLHYYDKIGLLKAHKNIKNNYRYYNKKELLLLQQILFYKELGFSLIEISKIILANDFDIIKSLKNQKNLLKIKKHNIEEIIYSIDKTILDYNKNIMTDYTELYKGAGKNYRKKAIEKYGKERIEKSENTLLGFGKDKIKENISLQKSNWKELFKLRTLDPASGKVQKLIQEHYNIVGTFWGHIPKKEEYIGLAQSYNDDILFVTIDDIEYPDFGIFLKESMTYFSNNL